MLALHQSINQVPQNAINVSINFTEKDALAGYFKKQKRALEPSYQWHPFRRVHGAKLLEELKLPNRSAGA